MQAYQSRVNPCMRARQPRGVRVLTRAQTQTAVPVKITLKKEVPFGHSFKIVGSEPELGKWNEGNGPLMKWTDGHVWVLDTKAPVGVDVCYKIVQLRDGRVIEWEHGEDRRFKAQGPDYSLNITCHWNDTRRLDVDAKPINKDGGGHSQESNGNGAHQKAPQQQQQQAPQSNGSAAPLKWVGGNVEFVTSKHSGDNRKGVWKTDGLPEGPLRQLVQGDEKAASWLLKLGIQKKLLVDSAQQMRPEADAIAAAYVYASWVNNGAILCSEAGSHNRPNRHAELALEMFRSMEWVIGSVPVGAKQTVADQEKVLAARKMVTTLPSFSGEFRQAVPLTRIRDIAHRNDIPQNVKQEIKHTLQNKLHRSAGPEDLVATEAMLEKITKNPGEFNDDFIKEFRIFTKELREFFNATGLVDLLNGTLPSLDETQKSAVQQFLSTKDAVEGNASATPEQLLSLLNASTLLRSYYATGLQVPLRNDVNDDKLSMRQRWRLSEIRLEEFNFVVLSRIINSLESINAVQKLAGATREDWSVPVAALTAGLRNMGLAQFNQGEMLAVETELKAWYDAAPFTDKKENALRAKATLERALRAATEFSEMVMDVYAEPAAKLGDALGVPHHMARVFGESEIRSSVAFQVSKLATLLVKAVRQAAQLESWDGLVTGEVSGRLMEVPSLNPEVMSGVKDDVILVVKSASGDEELGPLGEKLRGVILCQDLPHLSHLGVRARQEQVTFAMCDDIDYVSAHVKPLVGQQVTFSVSPSGVKLTKGGSSSTRKASTPSSAAPASGASSLASIKKASKANVVPAKSFTLDTCGAKSQKCLELEKLVAGASGKFKVPNSACLPFGVMDLAIKGSGKDKEYSELLSKLEDASLNGEALEGTCAKLQALLASVKVPEAALSGLSKSFDSKSLLVVRSSANVEDMAGMSAAGLYDSVVGVPASSSADVSAAICTVWASLYTRRAVLSRRAGGVKQADASMAVLVQELKAPEVSFVLHTTRPSDQNAGVLLAELAPGQGETLASGTRGSPWRFEVTKTDKAVKTLAFANFSKALNLPAAGGDDGGAASGGMTGKLVGETVDYSKQPVSADAAFRNKLAQSLCDVGVHIEEHFKKEAQDIEGGLVRPAGGGEPELYIFQTRPQS